MNLAYPQIQDALSDLLVYIPDSPEIDFISTEDLGIEDYSVTFGAVQHILSHNFQGFAVAIGYFYKNQLFMCPPQSHEVNWTEDHRIVAILRKNKGIGDEPGAAVTSNVEVPSDGSESEVKL